MHHGGGPSNVQRQVQRSKSTTAGTEAEEQQQQQPQQQQQQQQALAVSQQQQGATGHPQSPVTTFTSATAAASPSAPQSPNYQIIMSRSPVTGQNMNITLQNVGQMMTASGNQQITLTPLPLPNPASPGFQHQAAPQWRFEGTPSYIQVASPLPQTIQSQSPTQHSPVPLQAVPRGGAPASAAATLGVCGQSPTRFVDAGMLVRQISLGSPNAAGHFVYQDGTGLTQLAAPTAAGQVQLASPGAAGVARERRLSQPHSQTGGTIHHLGPQSPVATSSALQALGSPGHITTSNLPPQICSIIQGMMLEKPAQGMVATGGGVGVGGGIAATTTAAFGVPAPLTPSSPLCTTAPQGLSSMQLTQTSTTTTTTTTMVKKSLARKLEEVAPATPEVAQLRKQCLEHHSKKMDGLKEVFKEYLIELFFLQHLQGNMMDYLAFKKKPCVPLFTYLRQNDLDLEDEEEEEEQSEVINDEVKVVTGKDGQAGTPVAIAKQLPPNVSAAFSAQPQQFQVHQGMAGGGISNPMDLEALKRQQALAQAGGMPPTPQTVQIAGQKPNQQQYDPSKGPPVQNAASLHTPPPQLPGRLPQLSMAGLPLAALSQQQQQQMVLEAAQVQVSGGAAASAAAAAALQAQGQMKVVGAGAAAAAAGAVLTAVNPHTQLQAQLQQQMQQGLHLQMQQAAQQGMLQPGQATVALVRPVVDPSQAGGQRLIANSLQASSLSPAPLSAPGSLPSPLASAAGIRPTNALANPSHSKLATANGTSSLKSGSLGGGGSQSSAGQSSQESSQDKLAEQAKLESQMHQRIAELRKEGQWSASRLPRLQESSRPKSHWDYLLEEMQWMAADFAQERRWKMAAAKKLVRTCARYHDEQRKSAERVKKEEEMRMRHIAGTIAREVDFFWSNIEQVVEIKLRFQIYEKQQKAIRLQKTNSKGQSTKAATSAKEEEEKKAAPSEQRSSGRKRKHSTTHFEEEAEDEESTIEEQEAMEVEADQKAELEDLAKDAEVPLDALVKQYAGAYADDFDWPQPGSQSEDEEKEEVEEMEAPLGSPHEAVLIDSLLSMEQHRGADTSSSASADGGKPPKDIAEVASATEAILPKGQAKTSAPARFQAASLLHGSLRDYQQVGVDWLANLHKKHLNGILADEAGLGKTVQTVAYMAHLACNEGIWGPHLVVVRSSKLLSWEMEFKRWCPGLKILLYLGSPRERRRTRAWWSEANSFHVCVTSYKLLMKDQSHFVRRRWSHLVLDEVQLLKNVTEKHWETIFSIKSQQRILLINSPLQNTLRELWTMIHFLLPGITRPYADFPVKAATDQNQDYCHKLLIRLHRMIQPFILRRSKREVEKQLPKKYEHILKCRLSGRQKSLYDDVLTQPSAQEALKTGHFVSVLQVLMQLQRICNHPELLQQRAPRSSYVCQPLVYNTPSLVLDALRKDRDQSCDLSLFDLINNERSLSRYETEQAIPKLKVSKQLIEELHSAPDAPARPKPCRIKPMKLFQPVQYGTNPEGRLLPLTGATQAQRTGTSTTGPTTTAAGAGTTGTSSPAGQPRGKSPVTTAASTQAGQTASSSAPGAVAGGVPIPAPTLPMAAAPPRPLLAPQAALQPGLVSQRLVLSSQAQARLPSGDVVKIAQLASLAGAGGAGGAAGAQNRVAQPETPVTLQFQGNKFTLSPSQLRQLTTGQPLQLQGTLGNILQIVSAPGQQLLPRQGSMVMQTVPQQQQQAVAPVPNAATPGTPPPTSTTPAATAAATPPTTPQTDAAPNGKTPTPSTQAMSQESREEPVSPMSPERLARLLSANERRCSRAVLYGRDLLNACSLSHTAARPTHTSRTHHAYAATHRWRWVGSTGCQRAQETPVGTVAPLRAALLSHAEREEAGQDVANRFTCVVPPAVAPPPQMYASNPPAPYSLEHKAHALRLQVAGAAHSSDLRRATAPPLLCLPDRRALELDSGKLEALSILLHKLRAEKRRVLIFTQMLRMLDLLEAFLDHRHLTYTRVDERLTTEERQEQVRAFNRNRQVFCTILTNRCCSSMGPVLDADTVVFYDTDLNPSMDARTQEWCDRIGRSKDIHIYRLESGNSIEEKLLKNGTKDLIREVAAQGTDYTLAFLTQRTIQDLFEVEAGSGEKVEEFVVLPQEPSPSEAISPRVARPYIQALSSISLEPPLTDEEDEEEGGGGDRELEEEEEVEEKEVAKGKREEKKEDVGEERTGEVEVKEEALQLEELAAVVEQLTPIEKYALHYLEFLHLREDDKMAKERLESAKQGWELQLQQRLKVEQEEQLVMEEEDDLFTYTREDAYNMEYVFEHQDGQTEIMPLWTPPTPPQDDNDIYIDSVMCLMYDTAPMPEAKLPPIYVRKEHKRLKMDPSGGRKIKKKGHGEAVIPPRSLFDKASLLKVRRDSKEQKKNFSLKQQAPFPKPLPALVKPAAEVGQDNPEWLISEDWALLQAVKQLLELPLNLTIVSPAHTPNWDLVSDVVNSCSRIYRSPKQCRSRYENVIIPREEGKLMYEANPKKKTKSIYKTKNSRPLRTHQIYTQDDNSTHMQLYSSRFELMKIIASKRSPPIKPLLGMNPFQKNPKHASVLAESGISYDKPLHPIQVASQRAERIAKEKKAMAEQQRAQQLAQQAAGAPQAQAGVAQPQAQAGVAGQPQAAGVPQQAAVAGAAALPNTAVLAGAIKTAGAGTTLQAAAGGNVIVNTVAGVPAGQFQANKRLASPVIPGALTAAGTAAAQVVHAQQRAVPTAAAPAEVAAIPSGHVVRTVTPVTASAVVSTNLTPVQSQARSLVTQGMQLPPGKSLTQAHLQILRQQQLQQQQQAAGASPQIKAVGKPQQAELLKLQKQKLQLQQQQQVAAAVAAAQGAQAVPQAAQVQAAPSAAAAAAAQANPQLAAVAAPRPGAVLPVGTVANLQVARLTRVPAQSQLPAQAAQTAQVALSKPVVSVPAVVSSAGVTTLPVTVAGISVTIGQAQKAGGQVVTHPFQVQQVQQLLQQRQKQQQQAAAQAAAAAAAQQKAAGQPQQATATVQQKLASGQAAQAAQQQQKVAYATTTQLQQPIKTQYYTTTLAQPQKSPATQQIQVAKIVQQQSTVANIQQIVSSPQQVVQQKLLQQQVVTATAAAAAAAGSPQMQSPPPHSPAQQGASIATAAAATTPDATAPPAQASPAPAQGKGRGGGAARSKAPAKPSGGS
ncbi:E1A-binding protein p400 isoform X2 [Engraulis encrasicolus]|uniref:E1A-binding protein p400 isoform X2 n=1 Tax=Engraulis encrasicolus TaxID=184585 RepID=UPI002FD264EF